MIVQSRHEAVNPLPTWGNGCMTLAFILASVPYALSLISTSCYVHNDEDLSAGRLYYGGGGVRMTYISPRSVLDNTGRY